MKTVLKRNGKTVTIEPYNQIEKGILKTHRITETGQAYNSQKTAIKKAHFVLMKLALPEKEYNEKLEEIRRLKIAKSIIEDQTCLLETKAFINRWKGKIVVRNKTILYDALKQLIKEKCDSAGFGNVNSAIKFKDKCKRSFR